MCSCMLSYARNRHRDAYIVRMSNNVAGRWSSFAVFLVGVAYIVALVIGFTTRGLSAPIVDPLLAIMEMLTLIVAPLMLVMMAAIHGRASDDRKTGARLRSRS